jgi:hypothetical protein
MYLHGKTTVLYSLHPVQEYGSAFRLIPSNVNINPFQPIRIIQHLCKQAGSGDGEPVFIYAFSK